MNYPEILSRLANGEEFTSSNTITASDIQHTYHIARNSSEAVDAIRHPQAEHYIVLPEVSFTHECFDSALHCGGWIFVKPLSFGDTSFENNVDFSNCVFLDKLLMDMTTFSASIDLDYSTVAEAEFTHIDFDRYNISANRFSVIDQLNIWHCTFRSGFYLHTRSCSYRLRPTSARPVFNFSHSRFHDSFCLDFSDHANPEPALVLYKTILLGDVDISYEKLELNRYSNLIFDHRLYLERISDSIADKFRYEGDRANVMVKYKTVEVIKGSFETLFRYYQNKDTDRMLDLQYWYMKYGNYLNLYTDGSRWRKLHWLTSYLLLDLPFKYFTSWRATLRSIILALAVFFAIFLIFADHIQDSNGSDLTKYHFYININDTVDTDRIVNVVYFTFVTFTTLGYGDYHPTGFLKIIASLAAFVGILLTSIFTVTLAKRILG